MPLLPFMLPGVAPAYILKDVLHPFHWQVVGKKLEEAHRRQRLELPPSMPPELQALVWDCTHWDPRQRCVWWG